MTSSLVGLLINAGTLAMAWLGTAGDIEGARNLVHLFVWAVIVPLTLLALHPAVLRRAAQTPTTTADRWLLWPCRALWWATVGLFGWHGLWVTTAAMVFCTVLTAFGRMRVEILRAEAGEATS